MATNKSEKTKSRFFLSMPEFAAKVYAKFMESLGPTYQERLTLDLPNFTIKVSSASIYLNNIFSRCFLEDPNPSASRVDLLINEYVAKIVTGYLIRNNDSTARTFEMKKCYIFPIVRQIATVNAYNELARSFGNSDKLVYFPFQCLPSVGVSLAVIEGPIITSITKNMVDEWRKDPKAEVTFQSYSDMEDPQLDLILDTSGRRDTLKEELALLRLSKENFFNLLNKKYKKRSRMWHHTNVAYSARLEGQEYENLFASLLLLPELISKSELTVKGDIIAVASEANQLLVSGAQEPIALCFIGEMALDTRLSRYHISLEPLRLVEAGDGLWKWLHYIPNTENKECSVPINKIQVDIILQAMKKATHSKKLLLIPVFTNLRAPLSEQSQEEIQRNLVAQKAGKPYSTCLPLCWQCGAQEGELQKCDGCSLARYCERKCQKAHWKWHKKFCKRISATKCTT